MDTTVDRNTPYISSPWITTALSLRFNDALTYREIAAQLNVSSSATHKMFTRFRRTGINWLRPEDYTPERLEEELYAFNLETNLPVKKRRPDWPLEFKIRMAELSLQPDACVAQLAKEHGVNDNLVLTGVTSTDRACWIPLLAPGSYPLRLRFFPHGSGRAMGLRIRPQSSVVS
ncbi:transposase [Pantoea dispersa]|uniref:transposase n=1 Tax=Pantoea dispersa TaxID=59814 RepID=UPI003989EF5B